MRACKNNNKNIHILSISSYVWIVIFCLTIEPSFAKDPFDIALPNVAVIPKAKSAWIGKHMVVNGLPTSIKTFTYKGSAKEVKEFYRRYWRGRGTGEVSETFLGSETILGFEWRGFYETIQFYEENGLVQGKIVVTTSPSEYRYKPLKTQIPLLPGNTVKSRVDSKDGGIVTESTTIMSNRSVAMNLDYIRRELEIEGWREIVDSANYSNNKKYNEARKITLQNGSQIIQVIGYPTPLSGTRGCDLIVHWRK